MIEIDETLSIPDEELELSASRSGGPGGQHVNKVSTRVTLRFDVEGSPSLDSRQKRRIRRRLSTRINREGILRVVCQKHRSQSANRREVVARFADLLRHALRPRRTRVRTAIPAGERRRRLAEKRQRARLKRDRAKPRVDES